MDINHIIKRLSIKKGVNNSVHVEGISSFVYFLIESGIERRAINSLLKISLCLLSQNGTGTNRISASEYKRNHQEENDYINELINQLIY